MHGVVEVAGDLHRQRPVIEPCDNLPEEILPEPMKITALINRVTAQYKASEALVLPVEAQAARLAPIERACVNAADMPLSLKLPEGFIPSYCSTAAGRPDRHTGPRAAEAATAFALRRS